MVAEGITTGESYVASFGEEWTRFPRTQLDSANGTGISLQRFKQLSGIDPADLAGKRVLDAGCGTGRFVEIVARHAASVVGADLSKAADVAFQNTGHLPNVSILQADLHRLPFGADFDYVYSFGVIHHTPDTEEALNALVRYVKPGGRLCVWVYRRPGLTRLIPRPYQVLGPLVRALPEHTKQKVLLAYTHLALAARPIPGAKFVLPIQDIDRVGPTQDGWEPEPDRAKRDAIRFEWAHHSAVDMFTPAYMRQFRPDELRIMAERAGLEDIDMHPTLAAVSATKPV